MVKNMKINIAKYLTEVTVTDPDKNTPILISIFKHENGAVIGIDSNFIDKNFEDDENPLVPDPLNAECMVELDYEITDYDY